MIFDTQINGVPCKCRVTHYLPYVPAKVSGPPEDCYPAEPAEFDFSILDMQGDPAIGLEALVTGEDEQRLQDEYEAFVTAAKHGEDF